MAFGAEQLLENVRVRYGVMIAGGMLALSACGYVEKPDADEGAPSPMPTVSAEASTEPDDEFEEFDDWRTGAGRTGPKVAADQRLLEKTGCDIGPDGADGIAGDDTVSAIRTFQRNYNKTYPDKQIEVDGWIGPETREVLQDAQTDPKLKYCGLAKPPA